MNKITLLATFLCMLYLSGCNTKEFQLTLTKEANDLSFELGQKFDLKEMNLLSFNKEQQDMKDDILKDITWATSPIEVGKHTVKVTYHKQVVEVTYEIKDTTKPTITGVEDITTTVGEEVEYLKNIKTKDLSKVELTVDSSQVDLTKAGEYSITYTAMDEYGNKTVVDSKVMVKDQVKEDEGDLSTGNQGNSTNTTEPSTGSSNNTGTSGSTGTHETQIPSIAQVKEKLIRYGSSNGLKYDPSINQKNVYSCIEPVRDSSNGGSLDCINLFYQILKTTETSYGLDVKEVTVDGKVCCSMTLIFPPKEIIVTVTDAQVKQRLIDYGVSLGLKYDPSVNANNSYTAPWTEQMLSDGNGGIADCKTLISRHYKDKHGTDSFGISVETVTRNGKLYRRMVAYYPW